MKERPTTSPNPSADNSSSKVPGYTRHCALPPDTLLSTLPVSHTTPQSSPSTSLRKRHHKPPHRLHPTIRSLLLTLPVNLFPVSYPRPKVALQRRPTPLRLSQQPAITAKARSQHTPRLQADSPQSPRHRAPASTHTPQRPQHHHPRTRIPQIGTCVADLESQIHALRPRSRSRSPEACRRRCRASCWRSRRIGPRREVEA
jgi:hypothetical protein